MNSNLIFKNTVLFFALGVFSCGKSAQTSNLSQQQLPTTQQTINPIKTGAQNLVNNLNLLQNKKVGIITNQTGIIDNQTHLVDFLVEKKINVTKIYAPEHGFRGTADAGELIKDG